MAKKQKGESVFRYFRRIFEAHPDWLEQKSNDQVLAQYRQDHGLSADDPVEKRIRDAMANSKSLTKKRLRESGASTGAKSGRGGYRKTTQTGVSVSRMETLEEQIDDCLTMARSLDKETLTTVVRLLRKARNEVVWLMGQPNS